MSSTTAATNRQIGVMPIRTKTQTEFDQQRVRVKARCKTATAARQEVHDCDRKALFFKNQELRAHSKTAHAMRKHGAMEVWSRLRSKFKPEKFATAAHEVEAVLEEGETQHAAELDRLQHDYEAQKEDMEEDHMAMMEELGEKYQAKLDEIDIAEAEAETSTKVDSFYHEF